MLAGAALEGGSALRGRLLYDESPYGVGYFVTALALVMLTSMCWIFLFSNHLQEIRTALEEADAELDDYDSLRLLVDEVVYAGRGIKARERWADQHPPSEAHELFKKARQS